MYHKFITFSIKLIQLARVILLSFLQLLKLLFQSDLHLSSILTILVKQVLQMLDDVLFRQIVNSIGLIHVKCICAVDNGILSHSQIKPSCHHQFIFWDWIFCSVLFQIIFQTLNNFFLYLVSCQFNVEESFIFTSLKLCDEKLNISWTYIVVSDF